MICFYAVLLALDRVQKWLCQRTKTTSLAFMCAMNVVEAEEPLKCFSMLAEMSLEEFCFHIVNGISYLKSQKGLNWRLSAPDGEGDVDLVNGKYLKIIMDIAKKHDQVIMIVYENATPSFLKTLKI